MRNFCEHCGQSLGPLQQLGRQAIARQVMAQRQAMGASGLFGGLVLPVNPQTEFNREYKKLIESRKEKPNPTPDLDFYEGKVPRLRSETHIKVGLPEPGKKMLGR